MFLCIIRKNKSSPRRPWQMSAYGSLTRTMSYSHTQQQGKQGKQIFSSPFFYSQASLVAHKESACNAGDPGSIPGSGRSPGEGSGNSLQYPCLENSMDRRAWRVIVHRVTKSQTELIDLTLPLPLQSVVKNLPANVGDVGLIPGQGRSPGEGNDHPLQYSRLGNSTNRGAWQATVHGVAESQTQLSN